MKKDSLKLFQENGFKIDPFVFKNPLSFSTSFTCRGQKYHVNFHEFYGVLQVFAELDYATGGAREVIVFPIYHFDSFFWLFSQKTKQLSLNL